MRARSLVVAVACCAFSVSGPLCAEPATANAFSTLKSLVGRWKGPTSSGRTLDISYRLIANDSVLVETWRSPSGRETMTVYHIDGDELLATHYCAQGNQPRLRLAKTSARRLHFVFRDATNLPSADASHLHEFWIEKTGPETMTRSETYQEKGVPSEESATLRRVTTPRAR